jgi:hypothetical protein
MEEAEHRVCIEDVGCEKKPEIRLGKAGAITRILSTRFPRRGGAAAEANKFFAESRAFQKPSFCSPLLTGCGGKIQRG